MNTTRKPLSGLLLYFLYSAGGKLAISFLQTIAWGIAFLFTGNVWVHMIFGINAIAGAALIVIVGMGNKEVDWERFQLTMPVRRNDMIRSQFMSIALASLVGVPLFVIITGLSVLFHETAYFTLTTVFVSMAPFLATPFILGGLLFPLMCIKSLENKQDGFFSLLFLAAIGIPQLITWGAGRLGWSVEIASLLTLVVSLVIFIVSFFITKKLYAKMDF